MERLNRDAASIEERLVLTNCCEPGRKEATIYLFGLEPRQKGGRLRSFASRRRVAGRWKCGSFAARRQVSVHSQRGRVACFRSSPLVTVDPRAWGRYAADVVVVPLI